MLKNWRQNYVRRITSLYPHHYTLETTVLLIKSIATFTMPSSLYATKPTPKPIQLITSDDAKLLVDRDVAEQSILIKNLLEDLGADSEEPIPISNVRTTCRDSFDRPRLTV